MMPKCKLLILYFNCTTFLSHYVIACDFDMISNDLSDVPVTNVKYAQAKVKRETVSNFFPLRIDLHYGKVESTVTHSVLEELKKVLKKAILRVSELIHVVPISGPLLLQRLGCGGNWTFGVNRGLCSRVKQGYKGEFCENKIDLFQIPSNHLMGLDIFNSIESVPVYSYPTGQGVINADFILYVSVRISDWCQRQNVQAYASYCRLDQNRRPVAGFINFCPNHFSKKFDGKLLYYVAIHELFHCLGFSKDAFMKYKNCELMSNNCTNAKRVVIKDENEAYRLILPSVVQQMKKHFNCTNHEFGAPLEIMDDGSYGSHWDPLLMYGSIMAPSISEPDFTFIDPITLSVFADSGWYKLNLSGSDNYSWAKGSGCKFGSEGTCGGKQYHQLCSVSSKNISGCDYLHYTKTTCQKIKQTHLCGIFKPNMEVDCRMKEVSYDFQTNQINPSRCFVIGRNNVTNAICASYHCKSNSEIEIEYNGSKALCSSGSSVDLKESVVFCPDKKSLCSEDTVRRSFNYVNNLHNSAVGTKELDYRNMNAETASPLSNALWGKCIDLGILKILICVCLLFVHLRFLESL